VPNALTSGSPLSYAVFTAALLAVVAADLIASARRGAPPTTRGAAVWVGIWIGLATLFGFWIAHVRGTEAALAYFAAYVTEESLSLDNMVVFIAVFGYFGIPAAYQHRVLFWGILGAVVMRAAMILAGIALLDRVAWITYVFGAFLVIGGIRLLRREPGPGRGDMGTSRIISRIIPVTPGLRGAAFFARIDGRRAVTPLFVALIVIEFSDVVFATDSIPAVFGVTRDPFIVYTSNLLAVLGMRSLYFLLAGILPHLRFLRFGLAAILVFVGLKMLGGDVVEVPTGVSLSVILLSIGIAAGASLRWPGRVRAHESG
jgi:tellurite resistance protein TerC